MEAAPTDRTQNLIGFCPHVWPIRRALPPGQNPSHQFLPMSRRYIGQKRHENPCAVTSRSTVFLGGLLCKLLIRDDMMRNLVSLSVRLRRPTLYPIELLVHACIHSIVEQAENAPANAVNDSSSVCWASAMDAPQQVK